MRVTVFGGSSPKPGEPAYQEAEKLGALLGAAGHTVLTGGYIGTMEAVSRGVAEGGGHVIGVTCDQIEAWRSVNLNRWVQEEMRFATVRQRLDALIDNCDAAIALPGGIGTLAEIAQMWSNLQVGVIPRRPLILVGSGWKALIEQFYLDFNRYVPKMYRQLLYFAETSEDVIGILDQALDREMKKGNPLDV
jgi:uncharacterized protein (TIGR00730 family)